MGLKEIIGDFSFVMKVDVSNLNASVAWYEQKLGMVLDPRFSVPGSWEQLSVQGLQNFAWGLNNGTPQKGSDTPTFVVADIIAARDGLIAKGVNVTPIQTVALGVKLAFFADPDGNQLGLRQNPPDQPQEFA